MHIPIALHANQQVFHLSALVDSGAEGSFIHSDVIKENKIKTFPLKQPILVKNVNGSKNKEGYITRYIWKPIKTGDKVNYT